MRLRDRLKSHGCEVTDVVDHDFLRSIYFSDNNGIALEASWWVVDPTGRPVDYGDERLFADADPVPAVRELRRGRRARPHRRDQARPTGSSRTSTRALVAISGSVAESTGAPPTIPGVLADAAERDPDGIWLRTDDGWLTFGSAAGRVALAARSCARPGSTPETAWC